MDDALTCFVHGEQDEWLCVCRLCQEALEAELVECKAKLAETEERLKPSWYHDVDEFYREEVEDDV